VNPHPVPSHWPSEREHQVLYWMSHGQSNAAIGRKLGVSEDTVKTHARHLFRKLKARDRAHAVRRGFELGLLHVGQPAPVPSVTRVRVADPATAVVDALTALGWSPPLPVMAPGVAS
jgi:DNA-binding CsgD family transcriptional regulator